MSSLQIDVQMYNNRQSGTCRKSVRLWYVLVGDIKHTKKGLNRRIIDQNGIKNRRNSEPGEKEKPLPCSIEQIYPRWQINSISCAFALSCNGLSITEEHMWPNTDSTEAYGKDCSSGRRETNTPSIGLRVPPPLWAGYSYTTFLQIPACCSPLRTAITSATYHYVLLAESSTWS